MKCTTSLLKRNTTYVLPLCLFIIDYFMIVAGISLAVIGRKLWMFPPVAESFHIRSIYIYLIAPALFLFLMCLGHCYDIALPYWDRVRNLFKAVSFSVMFTVFFMYAANVAGDVSRLFILGSWIFTFVSLLLGRYLLQRVLIAKGILKIPVIIIGAGKTAELVLQSFERHPIMRYEIVGFIDDNPVCKNLIKKYPLLGGFCDIDDIVSQTKIQHVIVCAPGLSPDKLIALINRLEILVKNVSFVPELIGLPVANVSVQGLMEENMLLVNVQNNLARPFYRFVKCIFDIFLIVGTCWFSIPIMFIIGCVVWLNDPGPVFFSHIRIGRNGKTFKCYKFRTMVVNANIKLREYLATHPEAKEEWDKSYKLKNDPRITRVGHFLRKSSLDELPQLFNVLKGEMSLVGPRPIIRTEIRKYGDYIQDFYLVRPGITGVWQVSGRSDTTYDERVRMDSWYVHNWSVWIDIVYLVKTILVVIKRKGAY
ncbi:undecaprenyl-phosphate galactose phosphotransferase WbaP [Veillonella seminalis]|uniref:Undecaprenyl-phosphate galactose phosphotransferase, WbaP n=1 Tax=Veillonella seminalis ACS-216-V-Col6b TaxID=883156 RepID=K9D546_9FIRM|nr:undecaprenyl-phosphate galactose phosphotransferase WbaP [Veillonella seminalis]EKU79343.1 undecaprenyl-phosphate galactose phosphotransferase, WbaP [Veillonella seminalis ACS-216-V-Col6b]